MRKITLEVVDELGAYTARATAWITAAATEAINSRGSFLIALSGGSTPKPVYTALAAAPGIDWPRWQIFWSDERTVPPDNPESNFAMANALLLQPLAARGITPGRVERLQGEMDPDEAARLYDDALRTLGNGEAPHFDLILLGMGSDGHTASLFPNTSALDETDRLVVANAVPQHTTTRLTFTYPLLNAARSILFLVRGDDKAVALHAVLEGSADRSRWPAQYVQPLSGSVAWLLDNAAARLLDHP